MDGYDRAQEKVGDQNYRALTISKLPSGIGTCPRTKLRLIFEPASLHSVAFRGRHKSGALGDR